MANTLYDYVRRLMLAKELGWATTAGAAIDTLKIALVKTGGANYTFSATHQFFNTVSPHCAVQNDGTTKCIQTLTNPVTTTAGAADADDVTFPTVQAGQIIGAIVIYKDTGVESTSPLIAFIDTATGLPITANGGDIICVFDSGTNRIFRP